MNYFMLMAVKHSRKNLFHGQSRKLLAEKMQLGDFIEKLSARIELADDIKLR